ncbi:MAG: hypothetical protein Q9M43_06750 [Sulfurimonas sp.]|nr:hypothetical protein [Sulfurimonas sp.]
MEYLPIRSYLLNFQNRTSHTPLDRLFLGLGYKISDDDNDESIDITTFNFRNIIYVLTMMALKDTNLISNHFSLHKQVNYGKHVFEVYLKSVTE